MAKSRKKSARPSRPARSAGGRKKTARRARKAAARPKAAKVLNLRQLQADLRRAVSSLNARAAAGPALRASKMSDTQERLARMANEIDSICTDEEQEFCGPTMDIPLN